VANKNHVVSFPSDGQILPVRIMQDT